MKRRNYSLLLAAVLGMAAACTALPNAGRTVEESLPEVTFRTMRITAVPESDGATRTILDSDYSTVLWMPGDAINIFYKEESARFEATHTEGNVETAEFEGSVPDDGTENGEELYYGLYPYDSEAICTDGVVTTSLPASQTAVAGSFADDLFITLGYSETEVMPFYNVCSGIKFSLDRDDVTAVTFRANGGEPLAGSFRVGIDPDTERPVILEVIDGTSEVTLTVPDGGCFEPGTWYYMVVLPTVLEKGFTLETVGPEVPVWARTTTSLSLNRGKFRKAALAEGVYNSIDVDIENAKARAYLENVDYSDDLDSYSRSEIDNYTSSSSGGGGGPGGGSSGSSSSGNDKPLPVTFHWGVAGERTLTYATDEEFSDATTLSVSATETSTKLYNLIPGKTYWWETKDAVGTYSGTFVPVGPLRMIYGSTRNMRDLGGWTTTGGKTLRYGRIYRGAKPSTSDAELFHQLGISLVLDLRGSEGDQVFNDLDYMQFKVVQFMQSDGNTADLYQEALHSIINALSENKNVFFHCIQGADRTGTLAFLIEALLGVPEADLSKDYELTSFYNTRKRNDTGSRPFPVLPQYLKTFQGATFQEQVTAWAQTRFSDEVDPLSDEEIQALKSLMLQ